MTDATNKQLYNLPQIVKSKLNYLGPYTRITPHDPIVIKQEKCIICIEEYQSGLYKRNLSCNHVFHKKCIDKWLQQTNKCPICRCSHCTINLSN